MTDREIIAALVRALETCTPGDTSTGHVIYPSYDVAAVEAAIELGERRLAMPPLPGALLCSVCHQPQRNTPSGPVCSNGHGGVDGYTINPTPAG